MFFPNLRLNRILLAFIASLFLVSCGGPDLEDPAVQAAISESRNLGLAYLEENQLSDAEREFQRLIALNPMDPTGYANLGIVYLRRGAFDDAELNLNKAYAQSPNDPVIALSIAALYEQTNRTAQAREILETSLETNSDHVQTLYKRAQLFRDEPEALSSYITHLKTVIEKAPANIVPRFHLIEALSEAGESDEALSQLMELRQQVPEISREAQPHFEAAVTALQNKDTNTSSSSSRAFHNLMKATPYYQTSLRLLGVRSDAAVGIPLISEPTDFQPAGDANESAFILDSMQFTEASAGAGLAPISDDAVSITTSALLDFNGDNEMDLFVATWNARNQTNAFSLYQSRFGRFTDVAEEAGMIPSTSKSLQAFAFDFDNDTFIDLYVMNESQDQLFKNNGDGSFNEINDTGLEASAALVALAADVDHDGDLDIFIGRNGADLLYRNNLDGTFTEIGELSGISGAADATTRDADFGDFDDDGDLDLLITRSNGLHLYLNQQAGVFEDVSASQPFAGLTALSTSAVGDYNNDGFLDLFTQSNTGPHFFLNKGATLFEVDAGPDKSVNSTGSVRANFVDADNDGYLDLFLAGSQTQFLHNDGSGGFVDASDQLLNGFSATPINIAIDDYNGDRDVDLFLTTSKGIQLLRNDGGQQNRMVSIQTRGLVNNNSKNNYYSIGAKVEVRAGDLYQTQVVTQPVTYFGLGKRLKADVIRIVFTNGVPQNIFSPGSDQDIIEQQILKGSCPFLYTWNGSSYTFATDILWRSALGMPLGIMAGGETAYAPANIAKDYVMIPQDLLKEVDDEYRIKITGELWETPYLDEVKLVLIAHPESNRVLIDEKFGPALMGELPIHAIHTTIPVTGKNTNGQEVTSLLEKADQQFVAPIQSTRFQGLMDLHAITLQPADLVNPEKAVLYLKGWVFPTDASINVAMSQSDRYEPIPPRIQVRDNRGDWVTVIANAGFPMGKNKMVRVDLSDKFLTADHAVRIETNMQIYWDHAFFAEELDDSPLSRSVLSPVSADLQYRGFSRMYRSTPFGPHLFDYDSVVTAPRWLDLTGNYTRFGDVTELLQNTNDQYVIMNAGDAVSISFDASLAPVLPDGWTRSFILYTNGWLKDGDLNTATGKTVEPLPFEGMSAYPYDASESYPLTPQNQAYLNKYNTRKVTRNAFRAWIKDGD